MSLIVNQIKYRQTKEVNFTADQRKKMYSAHNKGKSVVAERFFRTLKNKIYKYMTLVSKNVYINNLAHIINKYNNITLLLTCVISNLYGEESAGTFYEKEMQKANQEEFKKVIKKKGDKLFLKWKDYDNSLNSQIDKRDII